MTYNKVGGKTKGLELLMQNTDLGFHVPHFEVINTSFYDAIQKQTIITDILSGIASTPYIATRLPKEFSNIIAELSKKFQGQQIIVRSSSLHEDSEHSFAGIYNSFLVDTLTESTLAQAVFDVYASMNTERAKSYRTQHDIKEDKMAIIVQKFIEPDWSGVMYTSKPSYPDDLTIEFVPGRNTVVEGTTKTYIIDFDKKSRERVFETKNLGIDYEPDNDIQFDLDNLANIGTSLEKRICPSDIEFVVKDRKFYLVQRRKITDLKESVKVKIPEYKDEQLIGSTKVCRGTGKITLPAIVLEDIDDVNERLIKMLRIEDNLTHDEILRDYFKNILENDKRYNSGYILVLPHFHETIMFVFKRYLPNFKNDPTIDNLTPNKKAVITTGFASRSSHIMTIARERGVLYAGFDNADELFKNVETGDILSIYFVGREARIYHEETPLRSIRETHPDISFSIERDEHRKGFIHVKTSKFICSTKPYINDFEYFLYELTGEKWTFKKFGDVMGGLFTNEQGKSILMGMAYMYGQWHEWYFCPAKITKLRGYKPIPDTQLKEIMQKYAIHLTKS